MSITRWHNFGTHRLEEIADVGTVAAGHLMRRGQD
jgi:hypothetical protein